MKIMHIIPSAFDYFNDIRHVAFKIVDHQTKSGVIADAITLQFQTTTKTAQGEVERPAPTRRFLGTVPVARALNNLSDYDLVNLHCPFFGAAGKIINWKKRCPGQPLVVTFYHEFWPADFFGLAIKYYNWFYLPKLLDLSEAITCFRLEDVRYSGLRSRLKDPKLLELLPLLSDAANPLTGEVEDVKIIGDEECRLAADNLMGIYYILINNAR